MTLNLVQRLAMAGRLHNDFDLTRGEAFIAGILIAGDMLQRDHMATLLAMKVAFDDWSKEHPDADDGITLYEDELVEFLATGEPSALKELTKVTQ